MIKSVVIPVNLGGRKVGLTTEVVEGDIPWLLGKKTLKQMKAILDLGRGLIRIGDLGHVEIPLRESRGGHVKIVFQETEEKKYVWWRAKD